MKQADFERAHQHQWQQIEAILSSNGSDSSVNLPALYRAVCSHLALAKHRRYSPDLVARLNDLAIRGYFALYAVSHRHQRQWLHFIVVAFPNAIYRNARFFYAAIALFILPLLAMGLASYIDAELIYSFYDPAELRGMESMYNPENEHIGRERDSEDDWMMFCFYIFNNVGIAFRTFATGLLFGLGSAFFLVFNGLAIGGAAGHITSAGYGDTFFTFVIGHSAFELTAIVLSGAAGLKMGAALLAPGPYKRLTALRLAATDAASIVYGAAIMLVIAAALEAFWSSQAALPSELKYAVGTVFWGLVIWYISTGWKGRGAGRGR